jgi:DNA helicase-2/ATP-dependent DNA helicase PcrA
MYARDILEELDPQQRQAVIHKGSPALILAGAGSGKTRTITGRVIWLLETWNVRPERILAVTFTNKAAGEMRQRLEEMAGEVAGRMWISTFHRACSRMLREQGEAIGVPRDFTVADESDQESLMRRVLKGLDGDADAAEAGRLLAGVGRLKEELLRPGDFRPRNRIEDRLGQAYELYQAALRRDRLLDFDDLLLEAERLLREHPAVLASYRDRFAHVLVDEFQDTSRAQYLVMRMLAGEGAGLFVVGDEDQSIYRWRGASPANFASLRSDYRALSVYKLERNYRSTPLILSAASGVIERSFDRTPKKLDPTREGGERIPLHVADDADLEARWIVSRVKNLILSRYRPGEVAVLYRVNAQAAPIERAMAMAGIPHRVIGGGRFFGRQEVKDLLAYLRLAVNPDDDPSWRRVLNTPPRGIGKVAREALESAAETGGCSLRRAAAVMAGEKGAAGKKIGVFSALLDDLHVHRESTPVDLLREVVGRSGYGEWLATGGLGEPEARLDAVRELERLLEGLESAGSLASFLDEVALLTAADDADADNSVSLMTIHCAKGLEFPVVFLPGLEEGILPHVRALTDPEELAEERRLCYVAMTRARDLLYLSRARSRMLWGRPQWNTPSRFLEDLPPHVVQADGERRLEFGHAPASFVDRSAPGDEYRVGCRVRHPVFGLGTILSREGSGEDLRLTVGFPGKGTRKLLARLANFQPLE